MGAGAYSSYQDICGTTIMGRKANKKNRSKQQKFREAKKKMHRVKLQEATRVPGNQAKRWPTGVTPLAPNLVETEQDPDYVAFCITKQLDEWNEFSFLWLRVAAAIRLGMYTLKPIDRTGRLRPFDVVPFGVSVGDKDYENEIGLRYEADKFLCYLVYGNDPRFREMFGYILLPSIKNDLPGDLSRMDYNIWVAKEPTADLCKRLAEFDLAEVE